MAVADKWLLIRNYDLWSHLTDDEYAELNVVHNFIEAAKGEYVYFEAFHHNKLYFIKEGFIRIGFIDESGSEIIREIIQRGEIFGQLTLEPKSLQGEFAQAYKSDVSLCAFTIDDFNHLLTKRPELALKYTKQVGTKLRTIENRLVNLLNKDVRTRLIHFFNQMVLQDNNREEQTSLCLPNHLTHEDVAHLIGSSRQTVSTLINEMTVEGLVQFTRQQLCFPDVKRLQNLANVV